jgi:hypothetical protein
MLMQLPFILRLQSVELQFRGAEASPGAQFGRLHLKFLERRRSHCNARHITMSCNANDILEVLRETRTKLDRDSGCLCRDMKLERSEYKVQVVQSGEYVRIAASVYGRCRRLNIAEANIERP